MPTHPSQKQRDYPTPPSFRRADPATLDVLRRLPTAFISDCLKRLKIRNTAMHGIVLQSAVADDCSVVGTAITSRWAPHTEIIPYHCSPFLLTEMIAEVQAGDVFVIAGMGQPYAFWGDNATQMALRRKLSGVVIDGYTRDIRAIRRLGFPVFSTGVTFDSYVLRSDAVGFNEPVNVAGALVCPGDIIMGDEDGVLAVPANMLERVMEVAADIERLEAALSTAVRAGQTWSEISQLHSRKYYAETPSDKS